MNDLFEDQLRTDLHTAAGRPAYDPIDLTQVIGEGRRLVRRRHRLQALGAAAAVAAVAVGGVLATGAGRTTTAPPAGVATASASTTALPAGSGLAVINVTQPRNRQFQVEVLPEQSTEANVAYYEVDLATQERRLMGRTSTRGIQGGTTWGTSPDAPGVVIGVMPQHGFGAVPLLGGQDVGGSSTSFDLVEGTPYQAFLVMSEDARLGQAFQGLVFSMPDGTVHGPSGALPLAGFPGSASTAGAKVWVAPEQNAFGLDRMGLEDVTPISQPRRFAAQLTTTLEGDVERGVIFGLVQHGSTDVGIEVTDATQLARPLATKPVEGSDYDAFLADVSGPAGRVGLLEVSWTDPSGAKQVQGVSRP